MQQRFDPNRRDFEPYGLSVTRWQPTPMNRTDRHNEIELNLVLKQPVTFQVGGRRITVPPSRTIVFWAAIPHQLVAPVCDEFYYVVTIPLSTFLRFDVPQPFKQAILSGCVLEADLPQVLPAAVSQLDAWIDAIGSSNETLRQATILEIQALCLRVAAVAALPSEDHKSKTLSAVNQVDVSAIERIAAYLALHYTEPLTIDQISAQVGLASGYAMSLFKRVLGQTIMENLLDHRLAHAQKLLVSTDRPILAIAFDSGFGSLSRFNTAFKRKCGCSPRAYRKQHGSQMLESAHLAE